MSRTDFINAYIKERENLDKRKIAYDNIKQYFEEITNRRVDDVINLYGIRDSVRNEPTSVFLFNTQFLEKDVASFNKITGILHDALRNYVHKYESNKMNDKEYASIEKKLMSYEKRIVKQRKRNIDLIEKYRDKYVENINKGGSFDKLIKKMNKDYEAIDFDNKKLINSFYLNNKCKAIIDLSEQLLMKLNEELSADNLMEEHRGIIKDNIDKITSTKKQCEDVIKRIKNLYPEQMAKLYRQACATYNKVYDEAVRRGVLKLSTDFRIQPNDLHYVQVNSIQPQQIQNTYTTYQNVNNGRMQRAINNEQIFNRAKIHHVADGSSTRSSSNSSNCAEIEGPAYDTKTSQLYKPERRPSLRK